MTSWTPARLEAHLARLTPGERVDFLALASRLPPCFTDAAFPHQTAFIRDPARFKVALCTRRAGKSFGVGAYLLEGGWETPGCNLLYLALTKDSAVAILWKDVLVELDDRLKLGCRFHKNDHHVELPNGSVLYLGGVDVDEDERKKQYGRKYKRIAIDESSSISTNLEELVYGVLQPTVADQLGTICMVGMPGDFTGNLFWRATKDQIPTRPGTWDWLDEAYGTRWKGFRWTAFDNPHMRENWRREIEEKRRNNPGIDGHPLFRQHYLGEWFVDPSNLVYKYAPGLHDFDQLPPGGEWFTYLGVDLGFVDDSAFVVAKYRRDDPVLYVVEATKRPGMDLGDVATQISLLEGRYRFDRKMVDGANKQAVETIRKRWGVYLTPAEKQEKWEHIQLMNSCFLGGTIRLLRGPATQPLRDEYAKLVRDTGSDKPREKEGLANHAADAALYVWRGAYHYLAKPEKKRPAYGTDEWAALDKERRLNEIASQQYGPPGF